MSPAADRTVKALPGKRWGAGPVSLLQAARLERRLSQDEVAALFQRLCPGHGLPRRECRVKAPKISMFEHGHRLTLQHVEVMCRLYQKSAEDLGLISWRTGSAPAPADEQDLAVPARTVQMEEGHAADPTIVRPVAVGGTVMEVAVTVRAATLHTTQSADRQTPPRPSAVAARAALVDVYALSDLAAVAGCSRDTARRWLVKGNYEHTRTDAGHYRIAGWVLREMLASVGIRFPDPAPATGAGPAGEGPQP